MVRKNDFETIGEALEDLKELVYSRKREAVSVPIGMVEDQDPFQMVLNEGEWTVFPQWPAMRCLLTKVEESTGSKYILCDVVREMNFGSHRHEGYVEEVVMIEGEMRDLIHQQRVRVGGRIKYPAGEPHWPVFDGPAVIMVIFRKVG